MTPRTLTEADLQAIADAVTDELHARGILPTREPIGILTAAQVAAELGRSRDWVYEHAGELGALRLGSGARPRLGFRRVDLDRWISARRIDKPAATMRQSTRRRRHRGASPPAVELIPYDDGGGAF